MDTDDSSYTYREMGGAFGDLISSKSPPLTLGIMTEQGCTDSFQLAVRARLSRNSIKSKNLKPNFFSFLWRLIFFLPSTSLPSFSRKDYIFVRLTTSDYLGTDKVYAGVLNTISLVLERKFGQISGKVFRAWNHNGRRDLLPYLTRAINSPNLKSNVWIPNRISYYLSYVTIIAGLALTVSLWAYFGVPDLSDQSTEPFGMSFITVALSSVISVGFISKLPAMFYGIFHLVVSQSQQIMKWTKGADLKNSLGFMWQIKMELKYINAFLRFMSHLLNRDINVIVMVDDVSRLGRNSMMTLFEVSSLLSSSRGSRFVQILTMNPLLVAGIVKKQIAYEMSSSLMGPRMFLRSYVNLFFHVQALNMQMKQWYLHLQAGGYNEIQQGKDSCKSIDADYEKHANMSLMSLDEWNEENPLIDSEDDVNDVLCLISDRCSIYKRLCSHLAGWNVMLKLITGNQDSILRILLGSELTVRLLQTKVKLSSSSIPESMLESVIRWSVLVEQWPYRASWIFLLIRENSERNGVYPDKVELIKETDLLEDILEKGKPVIKVVESSSYFSSYNNLLYLDEDPDIFLMFLRQFSLKVEDLLHSTTVRISLDKSIEKILSRCLRKSDDIQQDFELSFGPPHSESAGAHQ